MAFRLKQALVNYVMQTAESKYNLPLLGKTILGLSLKKKSQTNLVGSLKFYPAKDLQDGENKTAGFKNFNLKQGEIKIRGTQRQINFTGISENGLEFYFDLSRDDFIKDVLDSNPIEVVPITEKKNILVEFSSPNIAKEFHLGHLRSTMIGNFVANIMEKLGNDVIRMNYLGDWGTQFGMQIIGVELLGYTEESLKTDTLVKLNEAYVHANKVAGEDSSVSIKARDIFRKLENGDPEMLKKWQLFKEWSLADLVQMYKQLTVEFDYYDWESSYNKEKAVPFLKSMEEKGLLCDDEYGRKVVVVDGKNVPLLKSDGSTLYLLRDILAFFTRRKRFKFDKSYYVVDFSQEKHFIHLKKICELIEPGSSDKIEHVQVGRILKMSTRRGNNVLLREVLNEARERMYQRQLETETTKGKPSMKVSQILGMTGLVISDFIKTRTTHYEFNWDRVINAKKHPGIRFQYVHCRLCSIIKNSAETIASECDPSSFREREAIQLIIDIGRFEDVVYTTGNLMEPSILTGYMSELTTSINSAISILQVKGCDPYLASQRLYLFNASRLVVAECLRLLGLPALEEM